MGQASAHAMGQTGSGIIAKGAQVGEKIEKTIRTVPRRCNNAALHFGSKTRLKRSWQHCSFGQGDTT